MSTNILVTGDFHIKKSEIEDISNQLHFINDYISNHKIDYVCLLGDIFDKPKPGAEEIIVFINFIQHIPVNIPIYCIAGNHDWDGKTAAIDWLPLVRSNIVYNQGSLEVNVQGRKILLKHSDVAESKLGPLDISLQNNLSIKKFGTYDIVLLGHIHKSQIISKAHPLALHPGSITYTTFAERNDKKGFYVLSLVKNNNSIQFVKTNPIAMYQLEVNVNEDIKALLSKLPDKSKVKLIVKLNYRDLSDLAKLKDIKKELNRFYSKTLEVVDTQPTALTSINKVSKLDILSLLSEFSKELKLKENIYKELESIIKQIL